MKDRVFFDTNILIYLYSEDELVKRNVILKLIPEYQIIISTQVINELSHVFNRKFNISWAEIKKIKEEVISLFNLKIIDINTINEAYKIAEVYGYSYFDSLMLSSAIENDCKIIYSEDLHHSQMIENCLYIKNPFK